MIIYEKEVGIIIFIVCVFIGIVFFKEDKSSEKPAEYLIDIMIKNEEKINIDYIQMGIILPDGNKEIINTVRGAYSARTAHPFQRNGAPFRFKLSKAQQVY